MRPTEDQAGKVLHGHREWISWNFQVVAPYSEAGSVWTSRWLEARRSILQTSSMPLQRWRRRSPAHFGLPPDRRPPRPRPKAAEAEGEASAQARWRRRARPRRPIRSRLLGWSEAAFSLPSSLPRPNKGERGQGEMRCLPRNYCGLAPGKEGEEEEGP